MLFADLLSLHLVTFLMFFILVLIMIDKGSTGEAKHSKNQEIKNLNQMFFVLKGRGGTLGQKMECREGSCYFL